MTVAYATMTGLQVAHMPTFAAPRVHCGFEPDFAIQYYSRNAGDWRLWDCAYTRVEADNLLASYSRRYRAEGREWRVARIVYG